MIQCDEELCRVMVFLEFVESLIDDVKTTNPKAVDVLRIIGNKHAKTIICDSCKLKL
jgi:hypothetical protein